MLIEKSHQEEAALVAGSYSVNHPWDSFGSSEAAVGW